MLLNSVEFICLAFSYVSLIFSIDWFRVISNPREVWLNVNKFSGIGSITSIARRIDANQCRGIAFAGEQWSPIIALQGTN